MELQYRQGVTGTPRQLHWYERSAHLVCCANRLSITLMVSMLRGSVCDDVKTVSDGRSNTFLEVDGRFLQMSGMPGHACGREQFLPKPTCFSEERRWRSAQAGQALPELELLLDHLFCRNNTPVHVAKRLMNIISQFPSYERKALTYVFILPNRLILSFLRPSKFWCRVPPLTSFRQSSGCTSMTSSCVTPSGVTCGESERSPSNSTMSVWVIHRDSSSGEYNAGSPTKTPPVKSGTSLFWV